MQKRTLAIRVGLVLVGVFLSWRLLRFADPTFSLWRVHVMVASVAFLVCVPSLLRACFFQRTAMADFVLLFLTLAVARFLYFQAVDPFSFAVAMFVFYFFLERGFRNIDVEEFFHGFKFLVIFLLLFNVLDLFNLHFWGQRIFDYAAAEQRVAALDLSGLESRFKVNGLFEFIGRPPGVSGTPYATSAMIASAAIFFYVIRDRAMFLLATLLLGAWATGSSIVVFLFSMLCLTSRKWYFPFALGVGLTIALVVIEARGISEAYWDLRFRFDIVDFLVASIIGEGRNVSSIASEFRIIGLLSSLGLLGVIALAGMLANYWTCMSTARSRDQKQYYKAGLWFMATLFLSNWHYNTVFIFPNIVLVVSLFAFAGSRQNRIRLSEVGRCGEYAIWSRAPNQTA